MKHPGNWGMGRVKNHTLPPIHEIQGYVVGSQYYPVPIWNITMRSMERLVAGLEDCKGSYFQYFA